MKPLCCLFLLAISFLPALADRPRIVLWPEGPPGPKADATEPERVDRSSPGLNGFDLRKNVAEPRLVVFTPAEDRRTGAGCVVVPGGGFGILADEHEGSEACEWLSHLGVTAFLLVHRCPTNKHAEPNAGPVMDCQRAMAVVRERAGEWKLDPKKIGLLGFSAGGQVALVASTNTPVLGGSGMRHKPDFLLLLYPWRIYDEAKKDLRADVRLEEALPPLFIAQASDDKSSLPQGSALLYLRALQSHAAAAPMPELHLYRDGGHGFGMRPSQNGAACPTDWPKRAADWLRGLGLGR